MSNNPDTTRFDDMIADLTTDLETALSTYGFSGYADTLVQELEDRGVFDPEED